VPGSSSAYLPRSIIGSIQNQKQLNRLHSAVAKEKNGIEEGAQDSKSEDRPQTAYVRAPNFILLK
jgi:hypothetical protein